MAIPTSRTKIEGQINIIKEKCTGCGLCASVCKDFSLKIENNKVAVSNKAIFGCIACGHCMAICPNNAIKINGREISENDVFELNTDNNIDYDSLLTLLQKRRSIREFNDKIVDKEIIDKIINAAKTAPMGLPPSDVNVLILNSKEKTYSFAKDFSEYTKSMKFMTSNLFLFLMKPIWGKTNNEIFKSFIKPLFKTYTEDFDDGNNYINYDAPLAMYFYATPYADPADPIIAATYAMLAGEALGLGTCMLGAVHPFIQQGRKAKKFRENHNIKCKSKEGVFVIFGYPDVKYNKGINRTFASVEYL